MVIASITWLAALIVVMLSLKWAIVKTRVAVVAIVLVLSWQFIPRPLMFLLGFDQPYPNYLFQKDIWDLVSQSLIIFIVWLALFILSYSIFFQKSLSLQRVLPRVPDDKVGLILFTIAFITTLTGVLSTGYLIDSVGSIGSFMYQVKVGKAFAGYYVIREISITGAIFSGISLLYFEKKYRASNRKNRYRRVALLSVILYTTNLSFNYFWGNRYNIAMLLGALGIGWHFYIYKINIVKAALLILIASMMLQTLKNLRSENFGEVLFMDIKSTQPFWTDVSLSLHMSQFDGFMLAYQDAGKVFKLRNGKDFINGMLAFIPRKFYPNKETYAVGGWFRRVYQPEKINGWPITIIGNWYVNFGFLGILLGALISGTIAAIYDSINRNIRESYWQAGVAPPIAFFIFDGGVSTGFVQKIFLNVIPVIILAIILKRIGKNKRL
ncbi:MAG: oligosaccharide repeat unit polymerase [Candidatus Thiodiazotropha sp. 4PDIVS1]